MLPLRPWDRAFAVTFIWLSAFCKCRMCCCSSGPGCLCATAALAARTQLAEAGRRRAVDYELALKEELAQFERPMPVLTEYDLLLSGADAEVLQ